MWGVFVCGGCVFVVCVYDEWCACVWCVCIFGVFGVFVCVCFGVCGGFVSCGFVWIVWIVFCVCMCVLCL